MSALSNLAVLHSCKRSRSSKKTESVSLIYRLMIKRSSIVDRVEVIFNSKRITAEINGILLMLLSKVVREVAGWALHCLKIKDYR